MDSSTGHLRAATAYCELIARPQICLRTRREFLRTDDEHGCVHYGPTTGEHAFWLTNYSSHLFFCGSLIGQELYMMEWFDRHVRKCQVPCNYAHDHHELT